VGSTDLSPGTECYHLIVDLLVFLNLLVSGSYINIEELFFPCNTNIRLSQY